MYVPPENSIWIPLGIQRPPFFQYDSLDALNYGAIGMVLGHELTHGFDNMGSLFDAHGNFENWWTNATKEKFEQKQECFVKEYSNYTFPILDEIPGYKGPKSVNGKQTLGENIAGMNRSGNQFELKQFLKNNPVVTQPKPFPFLCEIVQIQREHS